MMQPGGVSTSEDTGEGQFHFDPSTYMDLMMEEVPSYRELQRNLAEATRGIVAASILELGVGTGETAFSVAAVHPAARLVGIDESGPMLDTARERLPNADLRVQRLEDPLPEGSYDLVVSALAVHHLDGPGKADLFRRVHDRLRPGGRFVVADVIVPENPDDVVTPVGDPYDKPSSVEDQLEWLRAASLEPKVCWLLKDLAVISADRSFPQ